jgi:hypothetical protein
MNNKLILIGIIFLFLLSSFSVLTSAESIYNFGSDYFYKENEIGAYSSFEKGFSLSGSDNEGGDDYWQEWRLNADFWFYKWCDSTISLASPSIEEISNIIQDSEVTFFYELAHSKGFPTRFQNARMSFYRASQLKEDMANRQPMKFAFIGSCEGMILTGPGTLSYEFRKGYTEGTVTIGYFFMDFCPGWDDSISWQDKLFEEMYAGKTIKQAFNLACEIYPDMACGVRFVGDENLVIGNNPPVTPEKPSGNHICKVNSDNVFKTKTFDPEVDSLYYLFDWGDGSDSKWVGPYDSNEECIQNHQWESTGSFTVKVKAKDETGLESEWSDSMSIIICKSVNKLNFLNELNLKYLFEKILSFFS